MQRQGAGCALMLGSSKELLMWIVGGVIAVVIAILSMIFAMEVYFALQEPAEQVPVLKDRR
jgi:hypothetical protein